MDTQKNWLSRELPDSFFTEAGHHSQDENTKLFAEIPEEFRALAYTIVVMTMESAKDKVMDKCFLFRQALFISYQDLKTQWGIDIELPHYWYMDGVMIEPELMVRATNGIIGWVCDESIEGCGRADECWFSSKKKATP